jgi:hypothetical protein
VGLFFALQAMSMAIRKHFLNVLRSPDYHREVNFYLYNLTSSINLSLITYLQYGGLMKHFFNGDLP